MSSTDDRSEDDGGRRDGTSSRPSGDGRGGDGDGRAGREGPLAPAARPAPEVSRPAPEGSRRARREVERGVSRETGAATTTSTAGTAGTDYRASTPTTDRASVVAREKDRFGGVKIGSAFFGWVAATGMAVVLVALLGALGLLVGAATSTDAGRAADSAARRAQADPSTAGLVSVVALLVVVLVAYFCGGYVAGRMARFDGLKQGVAVWLWAVVIAAVVAVVGLLVGNSPTLLSQVTLPTVDVSGSDLTTGGVLTVVAVAVVTLVGAVLGGLAGMRFHRRVDKAGLGH